MPPTMRYRIATFIKNRALMDRAICSYMLEAGYDKNSDPEAYVEYLRDTLPSVGFHKLVDAALAGKPEELNEFPKVW